MEWRVLTALFIINIFNCIESSPIVTKESLLQKCSSVLAFKDVFYTTGEVKNISGVPADLNVHWSTGNIYFTLISEEMKMTLKILRPSAELETIKVAGLGQSTAVDNLNDIIYLATDNGVYKYKEDGTIQLYAALGEDVMYIAVTADGATMYIATFPQNRVFVVNNDGQKIEPFTTIPNGHGIVVDTRNNIYFSASKTCHVLQNGHKVPVKIKGLPSEKITGVSVGRSDEVFAMDENSNFYKISKDAASAKYLGNFGMKEINTFALDENDNVLIGVKGGIHKFIVSESNPCVGLHLESQSKKGKRHSRRKSKTTSTTSTTEAVPDDEEDEDSLSSN